jgi:hypothetical protein
MARLLFNHMSQHFPKAAFVELDTDDLQGRRTQQLLVSALVQLGATRVNNRAPAPQLLMRLRELVKSEPVLLVVDNVWTAAQLDSLLPTSFHAGSRLVLTSRSFDLRSSFTYRVRG